MKKLGLSVFVLLTLTTQNHFGQIGKLKNLKNKVTNNSSSSSSNTSSVAVSAYDKAMKAGKKAESENDFITAYKEYNKALEEKTNDYSAKSAQTNITDKAEEQYNQQLKAALEKEDCEAYKTTIDDLTATIAMSPGRKESWEKQKSDCQTQINNQKNNTNKAAVAEKYNSLANGTYFEKGFHTVDNLKTANVGDDLWMNIKMGKTMMEYSAEFGLEGTFNAYGYFVIYMDGKKVATTKPLMFSSNYSKTWTDFDVPVSIQQDYGADKEKVTSLASTSQGMWVVSNLGNESFLNRIYVPFAIKNFASKNGPHQLKIEFGLGEKGGTEPKGIISSGEMTINVDDAGKKALYKKGPKYLQPLDDNERATVSMNNKAFKLGENNLTASFNLPQPPKYYAQKWCTSMSCDYDHGHISLSVTIDGIEIASHCEIWNDMWESQKSFEFTVIPKNDNELDNNLASFNQEELFEKARNNNIVYALVDLIYGGKIKAGKHNIKVEVFKEVAVGNDRHANQIGEQTFEVSFSDAQINNFIAKSNAKKLSHAGGEWTAVDNHLKSLYKEDRVVDVACYSEWKVTRNSLGVILYRTCKADIIYKTLSGGYRLLQGQEVKADYNGSSYSKPYFTGHFRTDWGSNMLNSGHFGIPGSKVK